MIFVNGRQVAELASDKVPAETTATLSIGCSNGVGTATITAMRTYELKSPE